MTPIQQTAEPFFAGALPRAVRVVRVRGVVLRVHPSWLLMFGLVVWLFGDRSQTLLWPYGIAGVVGAAVASTVLFVVSVLLHELAHALMARDRGVPIDELILFLFGAVTESTRVAHRARDEFIVVAAGPFTSLALASGFALLHSIAPGQTVFGVVTGYLAWANAALALFNVLPALPLDGGRLLRATLRAGGLRANRATLWAANAGLGTGALFAAAGMYGLLGGPVPLISGPLLYAALLLVSNGVWGLVIGLLLVHGAWCIRRQARRREALTVHTVGDVMEPGPLAAGPRTAERDHYPAEDVVSGGTTQIAAADLSSSTDAVKIEVDATLDEALDHLLMARGTMVIATENGRPAGRLTLRRIEEMLE